MMIPSEIFVSHASENHPFAMAVVDTLRRHGIPTWYSQTNIVGAQQWHDEIGAALNRCDWFLLILSPEATQSKWVKRELLFVLNEDRYENRIIPVQHQDCDVNQLSWVLNSLEMVDFRQDIEAGYHALFRIWGLGYQPA